MEFVRPGPSEFGRFIVLARSWGLGKRLGMAITTRTAFTIDSLFDVATSCA